MNSESSRRPEPGRGATTKRARVLVADDHEVFRRGLQAVLEAAGHDVCGTAPTGREAVLLAERLRPDLVILDLGMPDLNGLEAARRVYEQFPKTEILILTMHDEPEITREALALGARACVLKSEPERLIEEVQKLLEARGRN